MKKPKTKTKGGGGGAPKVGPLADYQQVFWIKYSCDQQIPNVRWRLDIYWFSFFDLLLLRLHH